MTTLQIVKLALQTRDFFTTYEFNETFIETCSRLDPNQLDQIYQLLYRFVNKEPNYYGIFKENIYQKQVELITMYLKSNYQITVEITSFIFWKRYFENINKITRAEFIEAFQDFFQDHPEEIYLEIPNEIYYDKFLEWCQGGIYEWFQSLTSSSKHIYKLSKNSFKIPELLGFNIDQISFGYGFIVFSTIYGNIYSYGKGTFGKLGHNNYNSYKEPKCIEYFKQHQIKCKKIVCGYAHTFLITDKNELFTWGAGDNGRLGLGDNRDRLSPCIVETLKGKNIKKVCAGSIHSCVLTYNGQVYSWGDQEVSGHNGTLPKLLEAFKDQEIIDISIGFGGYHTLALTKDSKVYSWGQNRVGQLGFSNDVTFPVNKENAFYFPEPKLIESISYLPVKKVVAGWGNSALITENGNLYVCGKNTQESLQGNFKINERGHLYTDKFSKQNVSNIQNVEFINDQMLILDKENNLFDQTNEYHFDQNIENIQTGMDSFYIQLGNYKVATLQEQCQKYLKNDP
jgi:alpha-tubulin suppressor-like RCC1 family protein